MLITSPILAFRSSAFPVAEGEDAATNPGIYGKALYAFADLGLFGRFRGKAAAEAATQELLAKVKAMLAAEASVSDLLVDETPA